MADIPTYVLEREFDAPPEMVWRTWTDPDLVPRWYGPNVESIVHRLDVRPGGLWLHEMRMPKGSGFQRSEYLEVVEPEKLVFLQSTCDADWTITSNPMMADWPRVLLTTVTFKADGDRTHMRLTWVPHEATDAEIECFASAIAGMDKGWSAGMDLLEKLLAELQATAK